MKEDLAPGEFEKDDARSLPEAHLDGAMTHAFQSMVSGSGLEDVIDQIAEGGMGRIYRVRDHSLNRILAMKALRPDVQRGFAARRLIQEARVTARLDHPGIVPVHQLTTDEAGRPRFTMRLVKGDTLADVLERGRGGDPEWSAPRLVQVLMRVCETMAYAHSRGVIHRDLKPMNIMVGGFGEVYVMDWGLCKVVGEAEEASAAVSSDDASLTMHGEILGTPYYISPEQAVGDLDALDARSDVYSLGAILYEILCGHAPYARAGVSTVQVLLGVRAGPPEPVADRARDAPDELVAIAEKAMARDPAERYSTAESLGADMQRFLDGRIVRAHGGSPWLRFRKWVKRNQAISAALAVALIAIVGGLVASLRFLDDALNERDVAQWERRRGALTAAATLLGSGDGVAADVALRGLPASDDAWEVRYLRSRLDESLHAFKGANIRFRRSDNHLLFTNGDVIALDPGTWTTTPLPTWESFDGHYNWDRDGRFCIHGTAAGGIQIHDMSEGRTLSPRYDVPGVMGVRMSRTGRVAIQEQVRQDHFQTTVYEIESGAVVRRTSSAFFDIDPEGQVLLEGELGGERTWLTQIEDGSRRDLPGVVDVVEHGSFAPQGPLVCVAARNNLHLYDRRTAARTRVIRATGPIHASSFSPDAKQIAVLTTRRLCIHETASGDVQREYILNDEGAFAIAFGAAGLVATEHASGTIRMWSAAPDPHVLRGHSEFNYSLAISPDGERLASGGWDGFRNEGRPVRLWDRRSGALIAAFGPARGSVIRVAFAETTDGAQLLAVYGFLPLSEDQPGQNFRMLYDLSSGRLVTHETCGGTGYAACQMDATGSKILSETEDGHLTWRVPKPGSPEGRERFKHAAFDENYGSPSGLQLDPGGRVLATTVGDQMEIVQLWDARTGQKLRALKGHLDQVRCIAFSGDGRIATGSTDNTIRIWDQRSGAEIAVLVDQGETIHNVLFDRGGDRLFSAGAGRAVYVWDARRYRKLMTLEGHTDYVYGLALAPDDQTLFSTGGDGTIRIWEPTPASVRLHAQHERTRIRTRLAPVVSTWGTPTQALERIETQRDWTDREREIARQIVLGRWLR